ncbi:hypothetical protein JXQ70_00300 [bacterium]|nr:hypothetical protein [bacterium]
MRKVVWSMFMLLFPLLANAERYNPVYVSEPSVPTISPAVRDLPEYKPDPATFGTEAHRRDTRGFTGPDLQGEPFENPLVERQRQAPQPAEDEIRAFETPIVNVGGIDENVCPPDPVGDVGLEHVLQSTNSAYAGSAVRVLNKDGSLVTTFYMEDLAAGAPCNSGCCDPVVQYDQLADRWMIAEFSNSGSNLCVYVSTSSDPTDTWYAYKFGNLSSFPDYAKYGVWPDAYLVSANNSGLVYALDRAKMLQGQAATYQQFTIGALPNFGFQLTMPATLEGPNAPALGTPAIFMRPRDTEIHGGTCPGCDLMEMWELHVDWTTPANSTLTKITSIQMTDWDHTLCGTGSDWSCMPQPSTSQKIDPIREPIHFPLQYRNFNTHETLVGCFAEDIDGTDHAGIRWFEIRRDTGSWYLYQEGSLGGDALHRSVCSAAMDGAGNIAVGYTRTGSSVPYYPSIYYAGRNATSPLGTMPLFEYRIMDGSASQTSNERWGDYSGIGIDPVDDRTFWYFSMYEEGTNNSDTRIASFKFASREVPTLSGGAIIVLLLLLSGLLGLVKARQES